MSHQRQQEKTKKGVAAAAAAAEAAAEAEKVDNDPSARCVIIGGGFAGSKIATYFDSIFDVTLIDEKNFLEASQTELLPVICKPWNDQASPLMARSLQFLHRFYLKNADILLGTACHVSDKYVTLADGRKQPYDLLILATGEQRPYPFSTQQRTISGRISELRAFNKFLEKDCKKIAIIGGGPMGVALASCLVENQPDKEVVLFHRQNEVTPGLPRHVRSHALRSLVSAHNNGLAATLAEEGEAGKECVQRIQKAQNIAADAEKSGSGGAYCPSLQVRLNSTVVDVRAQGSAITVPSPEFVIDNEERRMGAGLADPPQSTEASTSSSDNQPTKIITTTWWKRLLRIGPSADEIRNSQIENYITTIAEQLKDRQDVVLTHDPKAIRKATSAIPRTLTTANKFTVVVDECWKNDEVFSSDASAFAPVGGSSTSGGGGSWFYTIAGYIPPLLWMLPSEKLSHPSKPVLVGTGKRNLLLLSEEDAHRKIQNERSILHRVYFNTAVPKSSSFHADTFIPKFREERNAILGTDGSAAELTSDTGSSKSIRKEFKDFDYVFNLTGGIPRPIISPDPNSPLLKHIPAYIANPDFLDGTNPNILDEHVVTSNDSLFSFRHIAGLASDVAVTLVKRIQQDSSEKALYSPYAGAFDSVIGFAGGGLGGGANLQNNNGDGEGGGGNGGGSCKLVGKYRASSLLQLYRQPHIFAIGSCNALPWVNSVASADLQSKHLFKNMNKIISASIEAPKLWVGSIDGINPQRMRTPRITLPLGRSYFPDQPSGIIKIDQGPSSSSPSAEHEVVVVGNNGSSVYSNLGSSARYSNAIGSSDIAGAVTGAKAVEEHKNSYTSFYSEFIKPIFFKKTSRALTKAVVHNWIESDITDVTDFTFI